MEQEPPPITVVDPSGTADELGSDGPRRGLVLLLVLAVVLGVAALVSGVRRDRAADRLAVGEVQLTAADALDATPARFPLVRVAVRNDGPTAVHVLTARLAGAGYATERVDRAVDPGAFLVLTLTDSAECSPALPSHPSESVELQVRTARGSTVTRQLALSPAAFREVNHAARQRCGYLPADEAFRFEGVSMRLAPESVVVDARIASSSLIPVQLSRLLPLPGLDLGVTPGLPLALPTRSDVPLRLTLRVRDCRTFLRSYLQSVGGRGELVRAWLVQERTSVFEVPALTFDPESSSLPAVDASAIATHLLAPCDEG